ncbi:AMP-binding protein [Desulforhabdus amnigena]|uniref:Acyl-CoA synthetase n=1 Tax=Desulforhabdus amnigena TaxID=40218 RepID=A0A9W6FSA4_9BACT|nr:AMP-binding protein [Desulforhabdus amnigena]GLI33829.1 acyl-CoA synthetase [Desulforhabdus amnigena]
MNGEKTIFDPKEASNSLFKIIQELVSELHPGLPAARRVTLDVSLDRELGLDSLSRMELLARIERHFGVTLSERTFADADTPRDLLRALMCAGAPRAAATFETLLVKPDDVSDEPYSVETLVEMLAWHVRRHPDRLHIRLYSDEGEGESLSYVQLWEGAEVLAAGLQKHGLQPAEPVAIMLPTGKDYFFTFMGILMAGGVPVPMYPPVRKSQVEEHLRRHRAILGNCAAVTLITMPEARAFARLLKSQVETLRSVVTVEELSAASGTWREPVFGPQDMAFLQYTSGSTGNPKGVVLTHVNLLANIRAMGQALEVKPTDVFVSWLPLYHDMGLIGAWLGSLYYAVPLVIMSPLSFISRPERWLWAIHRYRGTLSAAPNFGYELCLKRLREEDLEGLDLSCWRGAFNGAEPVSPETLERFCERFSRYGFRREALMPVYGLAESSVGLAFPPLGRGPLIDAIDRDIFTREGRAVPVSEKDPRALRFVACGRPLAGHEIRILDPTGRELPERHEGRLQFRGPSTTSGYFRNPEQNRLLFNGDWLNSGDLAYISGGDIFITGRTKDIIIRAGRNIYPRELEEAVGNLAGIRKGNVVVFGSADPVSGTERLIVLCETRLTDPIELENLRQKITALTTDLVEMPPDEVVLSPPGTVLKTSSGKIRRAASRELYESGKIGRPQRAAWWQILRVVLSGLVPEMRRFKNLIVAGLYSGYAWMMVGILSPFVWLGILTLPNLSLRWKFMQRVARFLSGALRIPVTIQGAENIPRDCTCVMVVNHASYLDSYVLVGVLPVPVNFVAKAELLKNAGLRMFLNRIETEFVDRFDKQRGIEDARRIAGKARGGRPLMFFPEGTFTRMPGLLPFHMGAFSAAAEAGVPVIPIAIRGTRSILRSESWFFRRGSITVTIGQPLNTAEIKEQNDGDAWATALKLRDEARDFILRHCGEPDLSHEKSPV